MRVVVGLGNPGSEYKGTRHNVGFEVVDLLARRWNAKLKKWKSAADIAYVNAHDVVLVEPKTFMNDSGRAVQAVMTFYKAMPADMLIVFDEVQLPLGKLRLKPSGSHGGHNGLRSIIMHVGPEIPRLRIGVGRGDPDWDLSDHVLSRFLKVEHDIVNRAIERASDAVETFLEEGIFVAMNRFNTPEALNSEM